MVLETGLKYNPLVMTESEIEEALDYLEAIEENPEYDQKECDNLNNALANGDYFTTEKFQNEVMNELEDYPIKFDYLGDPYSFTTVGGIYQISGSYENETWRVECGGNYAYAASLAEALEGLK